MLIAKDGSGMAHEIRGYSCQLPKANLFSLRNLQVPGFSEAARPRNPLRRLPVALLVLCVFLWSCSPSSAGALLARQAIAAGRPAAFSAGGI